MIYEFSDYKRFLSAEIAQMPKKGRGQTRKLAEHIGVHPVVVSQILSADRDFTHEQGLEVASFFGLDERATDYLLTLILKARAGTKRLENRLNQKLSVMREEAMKLGNRLLELRTLSEKDKAIFYSNWFYSGVRLLTTIGGFDTIEAISEYFQLNRSKVSAIMNYLVEAGLCEQDEKGRFRNLTTSTFIDAESPLINNLHRNWRLKALEALPRRKANDFFYSAPCSISVADKDLFREELTKLVARFVKHVQSTNEEQLACLNIDWFDF